MAILGGSPLGIIGITSNPSGGYSTFNGGKTRNVAVASYNKSKELSLFTGKRKLRAWPGIKTYDLKNGKNELIEAGFQDTYGYSDVDYDLLRSSGGAKGDNFTQKTLHNNDVYDTSILNIIEKLAPTKAALRPSDFAYLKNLGVYPNNRLMIVRRFASPTDDNIMINRKSTEIPSLANVISWVSDGADFVSIDFGEKWGDAKADFTGLLNSLGEDFGRKASSFGLGDLLGAGAGAVPLPGFTEIFQRQFLKELGLLESASGIPSGNPNLIKEAKVRTTVGYGEAGSGLMCKISFNFEAEYELKFISGIDPTIVWMDIIGNIVRMGTSESSTYGFSKSAGSKLKSWVNNPDKLVSQVIKSVKDTISNVKVEVAKEINKVFDSTTKAIDSAMKDENYTEVAEKSGNGDKIWAQPDFLLAKKAKEASEELLNKIVTLGKDVIKATIQKYRTEIIGIVNALTGAPSTPWHITVGNPLRPVFCSGDMYIDSVTLKLGPQLAFNDLPSSIKCSFTITNARSLGLQEIMSKFNSGYIRTVDVQKTYYEINNPSTETIGGLPWESAPQTDPPSNGSAGTNSSDGNSQNKSSVPKDGGGGGDSSKSQAAGSTKVENGKEKKETINTNVKTPQK